MAALKSSKFQVPSSKWEFPKTSDVAIVLKMFFRRKRQGFLFGRSSLWRELSFEERAQRQSLEKEARLWRMAAWSWGLFGTSVLMGVAWVFLIDRLPIGSRIDFVLISETVLGIAVVSLPLAIVSGFRILLLCLRKARGSGDR